VIVTSETSPTAVAGAPDSGDEAPPRRSSRRLLGIFAIALLVVDAIAVIVAAPAGFPDPKSTILQNLEAVPPTVVWDLAPRAVTPSSALVIEFHPSITSSIVAAWIVMAVLLLAFALILRRVTLVPGPAQNATEAIYEFFANFAEGLGGERARPYVGIFVGLCLFITLTDWTDLLIFGDKVSAIRTPTSDINTTLGLALFSFVLTHFEGVRRLGLRAYLGKFFNFGGFKRGVADGVIDLYVGLIEFLLEFFKPITLAFRLFGNLYGGGIMLGVFTALVIAFVPVPFIGLEALIGAIQALIFASLTLMYVLTAIESHHEEEHAEPAFAGDPEGNVGPPLSTTQAHAG
jgi:F-type H+-transporting ATPase subunit a